MGAGGDCEGAVSMSGADEMEMAVREMNRRAREHKREAMESGAVELFMYYRALVKAGFKKKQAMKIVMAAVGRYRR